MIQFFSRYFFIEQVRVTLGGRHAHHTLGKKFSTQKELVSMEEKGQFYMAIAIAAIEAIGVPLGLIWETIKATFN